MVRMPFERTKPNPVYENDWTVDATVEVTAMEIDKGLHQLSSPSSRRVPDCLRMVIQEEGVVPKVHDEVLPHACRYKECMERV